MTKNVNLKGLNRLLFVAMAASFSYLAVRTFYVIVSTTVWYETILSVMFLFAEIFGLIHSLNYFVTLKMTLGPQEEQEVEAPLPLDYYPPVAIVVPSYHEPLSILRETLLCFYNLSYPNKHLYLLDDTRYDKPWDTPENVKQYRKDLEELCKWIGVNLYRRKWRGAKAGIINDFIKFRKGTTFEEQEFYEFQKKDSDEREQYIAVFDADMNPFPDFLEPLVECLERDPKLAFAQTPQYYSNFEVNRVARASGLQQVIFFEYICDGKGMKDAMFCCGSNVVLRIEALESVGGFDESSVTEDFATSLKMHLKGWGSLYYNKVSAFGMGPEDLGAFFKQQFRWALGTIQQARRLPKEMWRNYGKIPFKVWWEYIISSTHYLTGFFFFVMFLFPILYILWDIPGLLFSPVVYALVLLPYLLSSLLVTFWSLYLRNYTPYFVVNAVLISAISFSVYMKAAFYGLLGINSSFVVTPKSKCEPLPLRDLWPQIFVLLSCVAALTWAGNRIYFEGTNVVGYVGNMIWCFYNLVIISFVMYFNNPDGESWLDSSTEPSP